MVDGHVSAHKAEQIYDQRKVLQSIKDHIMKLEISQTMDGIQGLPVNEDLASRITAAHSRRDEKEAEIQQMESDFNEWLRDNS